MFYWLFTEGKALLGGCLAPLLCLTASTPLIVAGLLGAGIQRTGETESFRGRRRLYLRFAYAVVNLGVSALYLHLFSNFALVRQTGRATTNEFVLWLAGAPPTVNPMRVFMVGMGLIFTLMMVSIGLHSALRSGGWLHEWVDRLRRPVVKRGEMGSSHFCSSREYRRYRR